MGIRLGIIFTVIFMVIVLQHDVSPLLAQGVILGPDENLERVGPAVKSQEEHQEQINSRRQMLDKLQRPSDEQIQERFEKKNEQTLLDESNKPRPLNFFTSLSLTYPMILTWGDRQNYVVSPTSQFTVGFRPNSDHAINNWNLWYGARITPISGLGVYQKIHGRLGFIYFGPMVGLGKISPVSEAKDSSLNQSTVPEKPAPVIRAGWFHLGGLSVQQRMSKPEAGPPVPEGDLDNKIIAMDGAGLWVESSYVRIYYGALGTNYSAGLQLGSGKLYYWISFALSGWF